MCQIPIDILEYHVITNSSYQNLKICVSKVQKKYSKMNECMQLAQQLLNYDILLPVLNTFTVGTEEAFPRR